MLFVAIGALVLLAVAIIGGGLVYDNVVRPSQVVAQVGPDSITIAQLLNDVRPQARAIDAQAKQLGGSSSISSYVDQQKRSLPDQVLNDTIDATIVQQEATRRGISVSPAELDDNERQTVADYQSSTNPAPTPEAPPAAESSPDASPAGASDATPQATAAPTPAAVTTRTTPTPVPTLDTSAYGTALQSLLDDKSLTEADLRQQLERSMLRDRVQAAIGAGQFPDVQAQVHARQILVATSDQANDLLTQLQGGADFAQLVQQFSTDTATKSKGGDMGWFGHGSQTQALEDAAFALQPGQLSNVIQDPAGYHILQVLEADPQRQVPATELATQRSKAFTDWLSAQRSSSNVKISLDQGQKNWLLARIGVRP